MWGSALNDLSFASVQSYDAANLVWVNHTGEFVEKTYSVREILMTHWARDIYMTNWIYDISMTDWVCEILKFHLVRGLEDS